MGGKREKSGFLGLFLGFVYGTRPPFGRLVASISARINAAQSHQPAKVARIPRDCRRARAHLRRVFAGRWDGQTDRDQPGALFYALFCALHYLTQKRQKQNPYTREYLPYFPRGRVLKIRFLRNAV